VEAQRADRREADYLAALDPTAAWHGKAEPVTGDAVPSSSKQSNSGTSPLRGK
jgi:hypothetical protein